VQARALIAIHRPRDVDDVRIRLLRECARPGFALVARYAKPVGKSKVCGPTIRFAEAALRLWGNVDVQADVTYEDAEQRIIRVSIVDLETNASYSACVPVAKTVERKFLKDGQTAISYRTNSTGETTFLVEATEDDLANKQASAVSKAIRNSGLRLLPGDIVEECMDAVVATQRKGDAQDPDAARKKLADAFAGQGVKPSDLKAYLGHDLASCSPAEMQDLREVFAAIRDGETTWKAVLDQRRGDEQQPANGAPPPESPKDPATMSKVEVFAALDALRKVDPERFADKAIDCGIEGAWGVASEELQRRLLGALS